MVTSPVTDAGVVGPVEVVVVVVDELPPPPQLDSPTTSSAAAAKLNIRILRCLAAK